MIRRIEQVRQLLAPATAGVIEDTSTEFIALNQKQLYSGQLNDGSPLSPTYQEDPYFSSPEAAQRYSDWKDDITPDSQRAPGVPNLFINGRFYQSWSLSVTPKKITFQSSDPNAADIEEKFSVRIYGLNEDHMRQYRLTVFWPQFKREIMSRTQLKFAA